ncbi:Lnb N-terminal periplasmic domain-containing protein [Silvibacterium acidisoli]|uniref:Lnb N-terminal periplasmic domain-containing protein n=1 Tax=Acidobacteriaceae bacterium ZG23-2 TaxID=2883246 RepID=UPI00406BFCC5
MQTETPPSRLRNVFHVFLCIVLTLYGLWCGAALFFDVRIAWMRIPSILLFLAALALSLCLLKGFRNRLLACLACCLIVTVWWLSLRPSNHEKWQADVSRLASGDVSGSIITLHNVRDCDYRAELDYTCKWLTRTVDLNKLRGMDLFMDYWGSPYIAHTILSFDFGDGHPVAFSIEARKQIGQSYSAVRGFFRQYTLISVVSGERDVIRLRTNYRKDEDIYLFHTTATVPFMRQLFLDYVAFTNQLHDHAEWYNAITSNCTTEIFHLKAMHSQPFHLAILLNGKGDAMEYKLGNLATDGLSFDELKKRAYINPAAKAADKDPNFSERIREGRPGFENLSAAH